LRTIAAAGCFILLTGPAFAQNQSDTNLQTFEPAYFERFAPQTASEMLSRVPGFSVRQTGGGRGLGQGGANVLINGERVTSKDTGVIQILDRTPVAAVVRIEISDAASLGVTGLTGQVANVVLDRSRMSGSFEWATAFRKGAKPRLLQGSVSLSGQAGGLEYTLGFRNESWRGYEAGPELRLTSEGELIEERFETDNNRRERPTLTAALGYDLGPRTSLSLTGSATRFSFERKEVSEGQLDDRVAIRGEDEWNADISVELNRQTGPGTLKLIAYQRLEDSPITSRTVTSVGGEPVGIATFRQDQDEGESIGRAEYAWVNDEGASWELAVETAYNFLDVTSDLTEEEGGDLTTDVFPRTEVSEIRHQASITRGMTFWDKLAVQASLSGEYSELMVDGDVPPRSQTFLRPKGYISAAYTVFDDLDLRSRVERTVGQLSFFDFVDSVDLTEDRERAGNTTLVPQQGWLGEVELERRFTSEEKIILRVVGQLVEDRVDRVLIDGIDAVGNIDEAKSVEFETEGTVLTDRWSVPGGRFDFNYSRFGSRLKDPITLEDRGYNDTADWAYELDFRQDIPATPFAWGLGAEARDDRRVVRFNEVVRISAAAPQYSAFVEHKDLFGLNLRVSASNLANREIDLTRLRFAGLRTEEPLELIESRRRIENRFLFVNLSGTF
jgi:hypothetical protein